MEMPCNDHGTTTKERLGIDGRAPQYLLGKTRLSFGRVELTPDGGMDAVSADQDIGVIKQLDAVAIAEPGAYPVTALLKFCESKPAAKIFRTDAFAQGLQQQHLQFAAMDRVLWPSIPGRQPSWLAANQLPEFVEKAQLPRCQADLSQRVRKAKLGKLTHRRRLQIDARPKWSGVAHRLVHTDRDAGLM